MEPIRAIVRGAIGKMGREVCRSLRFEHDIKLVGAVVSPRQRERIKTLTHRAEEFDQVAVSDNLEYVIKQCQPDVMIDFTRASEAMPAVRTAAFNRVNQVIGTTGFSNSDIAEMRRLAESGDIGILLVPNFALGAVLMMHLSRIAARFMENSEIIELHHNRKADAPSGTAFSTAGTMVQTRIEGRSLPGDNGEKSRGERVGGSAIHSIRLPGLMAHQEVVMGVAGQTLSIKHDIYSPECYVKGVFLAIRQAVVRKGFSNSLDELIG
ncbi:MAG: 4-hydroxy-tetrahydrodipicolinate reductase [Dehalococcoidales bacterium]|nr:MAG: 4-hydroxy-tetrahydrodipicolinate reductase [Dehalococcoidales bacterium]